MHKCVDGTVVRLTLVFLHCDEAKVITMASDVDIHIDHTV